MLYLLYIIKFYLKKDSNMKILKRLTLLALTAAMLLCSLVSCSVSKAYKGAPEGMRPVSDGSNGVIMYISSEWSVDLSAGIPTAYFSFSDKAMVNMVTVPAEELGTLTIPEYFNSYKDKFKASVEGFEVIPYSSECEYMPRRGGKDSFDIYEYQYTFKLSTSSTSKAAYKFAQAFFKTSSESDLYIITYSTISGRFENHYNDIIELYENLKVTDKKITVDDDKELPKPEFTQDSKAPQGYSAITGEHIDYVLYVPSDWTPLINTGVTAASKSGDSTVTCTVTGFTLDNNDNVIDGKDYDSFFASNEKTIKESFGNITFTDEANKYVKVAFAGKTDTESITATRKYVYSVTVDGVSYTYEQYITIKEGDVFMLTFCCKSALYGENSSIFDGIASNFKFKG